MKDEVEVELLHFGRELLVGHPSEVFEVETVRFSELSEDESGLL